MNEIIKKIVKCKTCGISVEVIRNTELNLNNTNELNILNGLAYKTKCPHCSNEIEIPSDLLVFNVEKDYIIFLFCEENYAESIKYICENWNDISFGMAEEKGDERFLSAKVRITTSLEELKEKVEIFENGLDDRIIELIKYLSIEKEPKKQLFFKFHEGNIFLYDYLKPRGKRKQIPADLYEDLKTDFYSMNESKEKQNFIIDQRFAKAIIDKSIHFEPVHLEYIGNKKTVFVVSDIDDGEHFCSCDYYIPDGTRIYFTDGFEEYRGEIIAKTKLSNKEINDYCISLHKINQLLIDQNKTEKTKITFEDIKNHYNGLYKINKALLNQEEIDSIACVERYLQYPEYYHDCEMTPELFNEYRSGLITHSKIPHFIAKYPINDNEYNTRFIILNTINQIEDELLISEAKYRVIDTKVIDGKQFILVIMLPPLFGPYVANASFRNIQSITLYAQQSLKYTDANHSKKYLFDAQFPLGYNINKNKINTFKYDLELIVD